MSRLPLPLAAQSSFPSTLGTYLCTVQYNNSSLKPPILFRPPPPVAYSRNYGLRSPFQLLVSTEFICGSTRCGRTIDLSAGRLAIIYNAEIRGFPMCMMNLPPFGALTWRKGYLRSQPVHACIGFRYHVRCPPKPSTAPLLVQLRTLCLNRTYRHGAEWCGHAGGGSTAGRIVTEHQ